MPALAKISNVGFATNPLPSKRTFDADIFPNNFFSTGLFFS